MLKDKDSALGKNPFAKHKIRNLRQFLQRIRWVGKDEVKLLTAGLKETERIATHKTARVDVQLLQALAYEIRMVTVCLHTYHLAASS